MVPGAASGRYCEDWGKLGGWITEGARYCPDSGFKALPCGKHWDLVEKQWEG